MNEQLRRIGLSLGADICWPICFESILQRLDPEIRIGGNRIRVACERVTIEPFNLRQDCRYDLVIDRLSHWYYPTREWLKKSILLNGLYVFNNPWSLQSMEKQTSYSAMMRLGLPIPDTWLLPPKEYDHTDDLEPTLKQYARLFSLSAVGEQIGYPLFMKPYNGGAWAGVSKIDNEHDLREAYESSGKQVMILQKGVWPYEHFIRAVGVGPQIRLVKYQPEAPLHDRYGLARGFLNETDVSEIADTTLTINSFFGWDFNSCESLKKDGIWYPIDFANACPDSQVNSLHYHFPWLVKAKLRWALFCAATDRPMRRNLHWQPYYDIADSDLSDREKLAQFATLARAGFDQERFVEFCATHLRDLDAVAWEFFGTEVARDAIRQKVVALFPAHEVDTFVDLFWGRVQDWREAEGRNGDPVDSLVS
ncbi:MAG: ATP-grasp domain-containing protein [Gammaproteobacteria bacterium]